MYHPPAPVQTQVNSSSEVNKVRIVEVSEEFIKERNASAIATELADAFKSEYKAKTFFIGDIEIGLMCWDGRKYYDCEAQALEFLEFNYRYNELDNYAIKRTSLVKEFMIALKHSSHYPLSYERLMISFNNTVLDWESLLNGDLVNAFKPHDPNVIVFHHIPHNLNVELLNELFKGLELYTKFKGIEVRTLEELAKKYTPKTLEAFKLWTGDKWVLLYEIIGYVLYPRPVKKAFFIVGDTDTGKSTYLNLIERLVGSDNVSHLKLQELVNPEYRFRASRIYRKLVNIYADLPTQALTNLGDFKVLTGGDSVEIERKFKEPFSWKVYTKFIFSANEPPIPKNPDKAFWNRWVVIEFNNEIPKDKQIPEYHETLLTEASNILTLSVLAFCNVLIRNLRFSFEDTPEDSKIKWMTKADIVFAWLHTKQLEGKLIEDPTARTEAKKLYEDFIEWCNNNNIEEIERPAQNIFTSRLKSYGYKTITDGNRTVFIGLKLKT